VKTSNLTKSVLSYVRWSIGQSLNLSGHHLRYSANFPMKVSLDGCLFVVMKVSLEFCWFVVKWRTLWGENATLSYSSWWISPVEYFSGRSCMALMFIINFSPKFETPSHNLGDQVPVFIPLGKNAIDTHHQLYPVISFIESVCTSQETL
jgi:hypothetical protein